MQPLEAMADTVHGAYLLVVISEPASQDHKDVILRKISKGFLSWDMESTGCCISAELQYLVDQAPVAEEAKNGEKLVQFVSENLVTEVLINPLANTLQQCMRNLLGSFTRHKHVIHAGYAFSSSGSWIVQDGVYSFCDFTNHFKDPELERMLRAYQNTITVHIHCIAEGEWASSVAGDRGIPKYANVSVNPADRSPKFQGVANFVSFLSRLVQARPLEDALEASDIVGNIRFSRPTLYVFPGGQGDSSLFGVNGFNMLVDGGFSRKPCFWDFARHLDRVDAVLMSRVSQSNIGGIGSLLKRKALGHVYPQIGHVFCNLVEGGSNSPDGDKDKDSLLINVVDEGHKMVANLRHLGLRPQDCSRDANVVRPINLYHKVGHGTLDMYVLNPAKDSKEVKDFLQQWQAETIAESDSRVGIPLPNLVSICALLVWRPADPSDSITRVLFPGSVPQNKIFEGLDTLKGLAALKAPVCSEESLHKATVTATKTPNKVVRIVAGTTIDDKGGRASPQRLTKAPVEDTPKQIHKIKEKKEIRATPVVAAPKAPAEIKRKPTPPVSVSKITNGTTASVKNAVKSEPPKAPTPQPPKAPTPQPPKAKGLKEANNKKTVEAKNRIAKQEVIQPRKPIGKISPVAAKVEKKVARKGSAEKEHPAKVSAQVEPKKEKEVETGAPVPVVTKDAALVVPVPEQVEKDDQEVVLKAEDTPPEEIHVDQQAEPHILILEKDVEEPVEVEPTPEAAPQTEEIQPSDFNIPQEAAEAQHEEELKDEEEVEVQHVLQEVEHQEPEKYEAADIMQQAYTAQEKHELEAIEDRFMETAILGIGGDLGFVESSIQKPLHKVEVEKHSMPDYPKTPDEVAELPIHEVAPTESYEYYAAKLGAQILDDSGDSEDLQDHDDEEPPQVHHIEESEFLIKGQIDSKPDVAHEHDLRHELEQATQDAYPELKDIEAYGEHVILDTQHFKTEDIHEEQEHLDIHQDIKATTEPVQDIEKHVEIAEPERTHAHLDYHHELEEGKPIGTLDTLVYPDVHPELESSKVLEEEHDVIHKGLEETEAIGKQSDEKAQHEFRHPEIGITTYSDVHILETSTPASERLDDQEQQDEHVHFEAQPGAPELEAQTALEAKLEEHKHDEFADQDAKVELETSAGVAEKLEEHTNVHLDSHSDIQPKVHPDVQPEFLIKSQHDAQDIHPDRHSGKSDVSFDGQQEIHPDVHDIHAKDLSEINSDIHPDAHLDLHPDLHHEVKPDLHPEVKTDLHPEVKPDLHPEVKPDVHPEGKPDVHPEVKTDLHPEVKPDLHPEVKPDLHPEVKPDLHPEVQPDLQPETQLDLHHEAQPDLHIDTKSDVHPGVHIDTKSDVNVDAKSAAYIDVQPDDHIDAQSDDHIDAKSDVQLDAKSSAYIDAKSDVHIGAQLEVHADVHIDTKSDVHHDAHIDSKAEVQHDVHSEAKTEVHPDFQIDTKYDIDADYHTEVQLDIQPDAHLDNKSDHHIDAKSDIQTHTESNVHSDVDADKLDIQPKMGDDKIPSAPGPMTEFHHDATSELPHIISGASQYDLHPLAKDHEPIATKTEDTMSTEAETKSIETVEKDLDSHSPHADIVSDHFPTLTTSTESYEVDPSQVVLNVVDNLGTVPFAEHSATDEQEAQKTSIDSSISDRLSDSEDQQHGTAEPEILKTSEVIQEIAHLEKGTASSVSSAEQTLITSKNIELDHAHPIATVLEKVEPDIIGQVSVPTKFDEQEIQFTHVADIKETVPADVRILPSSYDEKEIITGILEKPEHYGGTIDISTHTLPSDHDALKQTVCSASDKTDSDVESVEMSGSEHRIEDCILPPDSMESSIIKAPSEESLNIGMKHLDHSEPRTPSPLAKESDIAQTLEPLDPTIQGLQLSKDIDIKSSDEEEHTTDAVPADTSLKSADFSDQDLSHDASITPEPLDEVLKEDSKFEHIVMPSTRKSDLVESDTSDVDSIKTSSDKGYTSIEPTETRKISTSSMEDEIQSFTPVVTSEYGRVSSRTSEQEFEIVDRKTPDRPSSEKSISPTVPEHLHYDVTTIEASSTDFKPYVLPIDHFEHTTTTTTVKIFDENDRDVTSPDTLEKTNEIIFDKHDSDSVVSKSQEHDTTVLESSSKLQYEPDLLPAEHVISPVPAISDDHHTVEILETGQKSPERHEAGTVIRSEPTETNVGTTVLLGKIGAEPSQIETDLKASQSKGLQTSNIEEISGTTSITTLDITPSLHPEPISGQSSDGDDDEDEDRRSRQSPQLLVQPPDLIATNESTKVLLAADGERTRSPSYRRESACSSPLGDILEVDREDILEEQVQLGCTSKADFAEVVTLSEGTSPSTPQSPHSPKDQDDLNKQGTIQARDKSGDSKDASSSDVDEGVYVAMRRSPDLMSASFYDQATSGRDTFVDHVEEEEHPFLDVSKDHGHDLGASTVRPTVGDQDTLWYDSPMALKPSTVEDVATAPSPILPDSERQEYEGYYEAHTFVKDDDEDDDDDDDDDRMSVPKQTILSPKEYASLEFKDSEDVVVADSHSQKRAEELYRPDSRDSSDSRNMPATELRNLPDVTQSPMHSGSYVSAEDSDDDERGLSPEHRHQHALEESRSSTSDDSQVESTRRAHQPEDKFYDLPSAPTQGADQGLTSEQGGGQSAQWTDDYVHVRTPEEDNWQQVHYSTDEEEEEEEDEDDDEDGEGEEKYYEGDTREFEGNLADNLRTASHQQVSDSGDEEEYSSGHSLPGFEMDSPQARHTPLEFKNRHAREKHFAEAVANNNLSSPSSGTDDNRSPQDDKNKPATGKAPFEDWGEPMGLPSPPPPIETKVKPRSTPPHAKKVQPNGNGTTATSNGKQPAMCGSPKRLNAKKQEAGKRSPVYVDLAYVPHHASLNYCDVEFFRSVRARYYVFSGTDPSKEVLDALLEGKGSWEDPDLDVTIVPTYDTDTLGYWYALNEHALAKHRIDLAPSASRCTINLQDHETSCSAYRLEF